MDRHDIQNNLLDVLDFEALGERVFDDLEQDDLIARSEYAQERDLETDDIDFSDPETLKDFRLFLKDHAWGRVDDAFDEVVWNLQTCEDGIRVWRSIMVDPAWLDGAVFDRPVGIYWTFDEDAAECHWGDFSDEKCEIRIEGIVSPEDVDWEATICANARMDEEKEVRMKDSAFVRTISATWMSRWGGGSPSAVEFCAVLPAGQEAFENSQGSPSLIAA